MRFGIDKTNKIFLILLLSLYCFGQIACGQSAAQKEKERIEQVSKHEETAKQLRIKGDFQAALQEQQKAVELNPDDDESLNLLGGIYIELKQWNKAIEVLEKGEKINPNNAWIHYELAWAFGELKDKKKSLAELKDAVRLNPKNTMFLINLGSAYEETDDKKSAKESYQKAIESDSDYTPAIYLLALLEMEDGNKTKSIELLNKVISIEPKTDTEKVYYDEANKKLKELEQSKK